MEIFHENINPDDLPGYILDEIESFNREHQIILDDQGFVHGDMTPTDVLNLGYKLIAWVLNSKGNNNGLD